MDFGFKLDINLATMISKAMKRDQTIRAHLGDDRDRKNPTRGKSF